MASATIAPNRQDCGKPLLFAAIVISVLGTTLDQPHVLGRIPFQNLLKNELHVDRAANAVFFFGWVLRGISNRFSGSSPMLFRSSEAPARAT
jgi:hypothetical protein